MKTVRYSAGILFYFSRIAAYIVTTITLYALAVLLLYQNGLHSLPIEVTHKAFTIFLPFSRIPFLLGDYTPSYLISNISTVAFYAVFLWLLSDVFQAFRQPKLFTLR